MKQTGLTDNDPRIGNTPDNCKKYLSEHPNRYLLKIDGEPYQCHDLDKHTEWFISTVGKGVFL